MSRENTDTEPGMKNFLYEHRFHIATAVAVIGIVEYTRFQYGTEGVMQLARLAPWVAVIVSFLAVSVLYYEMWKEDKMQNSDTHLNPDSFDFRVTMMVGILLGILLMVPAPEPWSMVLPVAGIVIGTALGSVVNGVRYGDA